MQSVDLGSTLHNKPAKFNVLLQTFPSKSLANLFLNSSKILFSRSEFLIESEARSVESLFVAGLCLEGHPDTHNMNIQRGSIHIIF